MEHFYHIMKTYDLFDKILDEFEDDVDYSFTAFRDSYGWEGLEKLRDKLIRELFSETMTTEEAIAITKKTIDEWK